MDLCRGNRLNSRWISRLVYNCGFSELATDEISGREAEAVRDSTTAGRLEHMS